MIEALDIAAVGIGYAWLFIVALAAAALLGWHALEIAIAGAFELCIWWTTWRAERDPDHPRPGQQLGDDGPDRSQHLRPSPVHPAANVVELGEVVSRKAPGGFR